MHRVITQVSPLDRLRKARADTFQRKVSLARYFRLAFKSLLERKRVLLHRARKFRDGHRRGLAVKALSALLFNMLEQRKKRP
jgi:hypothetical protein